MNLENVKPGDELFIAYLAYGKLPTIDHVTVKGIGTKALVTVRHGRYKLEHLACFKTRVEALSHMVALVEHHIAGLQKEVQSWEERRAEYRGEIESLGGKVR